MTRLYNQTGKPLAFGFLAESYTCDPFGSIQVHEDHVALLLARGLPLGRSPVPKDDVAKQAREEAAMAAQGSELAKALGDVAKLTEAHELTKGELEKVAAERDALAKQLEDIEGLKAEAQRKAEEADELRAALSQAQTTIVELEAKLAAPAASSKRK